MADVTPDFQYGYVVGRYVSSVGDGADADRFPDFVAPAGVKPKFNRRSGQYAHPAPAAGGGARGVLVSHDSVTTALMPDGHLTSDLDNKQNATTTAEPGVWLVVGQYVVTAGPKFPEITIEVTEAHTKENPLDLSEALGIQPGPGEVFNTVKLPTGTAEPGQIMVWTGTAMEWRDPEFGDAEIAGTLADTASQSRVALDGATADHIATDGTGTRAALDAAIAAEAPDAVAGAVSDELSSVRAALDPVLSDAVTTQAPTAVAGQLGTEASEVRTALAPVVTGAITAEAPTVIEGQIVDEASSLRSALNAATAEVIAPIQRRQDGVPVFTAGMQARAQNADAYLNTPTYDGSGEVVHPSVVRIPGGFGGYEFWMAHTPYTGTDSSKENPSVIASHDGITWVDSPNGVVNPIYPRPTGDPADFNSDTNIHFTGTHLYVFFRSYQKSQPGAEERFYYRRTADGVTWEPAVLCYSSPETRQLVSPAFIYRRDEGKWIMWTVETTTPTNRLIRMESSTLEPGSWGNEVPVVGVDLPGDYEPWHAEVTDNGGEYTLLLNPSPGGTSSPSGILIRAVSTDGVNFTMDPDPMLGKTQGKWDAALYKATMIPASVGGRPGYRLWYGAYNGAGAGWRVGHTWVRLLTSEEAAGTIALRDALMGLSGVADTFAKPDSTTDIGALSDGTPWLIGGGKPGIQGGALYSTDGSFSTAYIERAADMEVHLEVSGASAGGGQMWAIARREGAVDYIRFGTAGGAQSGWEMRQYIAGVATIVLAGLPVPLESAHSLSLVVEGDQCRGYVNGIRVLSETIVPTAGAGVGAQFSGTPRVDTFRATPL